MIENLIDKRMVKSFSRVRNTVDEYVVLSILLTGIWDTVCNSFMFTFRDMGV